MSVVEVALSKERTINDVHQEYTARCAEAGHLSYQISVQMDALDVLQAKLKELNLEAAALAAKEKKSE